MSHDQWALFYNKYNVLYSTIKAEFNPVDITASVGAVVCGIKLDDSNAFAGSTVSHLLETGQVSYKLAPTQRQTITTVNQVFKPRDYFNLVDVKDDDKLTADFGDLPAEQAYWHVYVQQLDLAENPPAYNVLVTIDYIVSLKEPKELSQS
jgi:hypothetical protein